MSTAVLRVSLVREKHCPCDKASLYFVLKQEKYYYHNLKVITNLGNQRKEMTTTNHSSIQSIFMYQFYF